MVATGIGIKDVSSPTYLKAELNSGRINFVKMLNEISKIFMLLEPVGGRF
jgi:hypothetical protein